MARRRRSYSGMVQLGAISLEDNVKVVDVLVGGAVGLVGSGLLKMAIAKVAPTAWDKAKTMLGQFLPAVTGVGAGAALYLAQKDSAPGRATGHAVGAAMAGVALSIQKVLETQRPFGIDFGEAVEVNMGMLVNNPNPQLGMLVENPINQPMLNELAALSMGDHDDDGFAALAGMQ